MEYGFIITAAGRRILAGLLAGQTLTLSRIMVGKGNISSVEEMARLTDLVQPVAEATSTVPAVSAEGDSVSFIVEYRSDLNGGLKEGFWLSEFGVFAQNPGRPEEDVRHPEERQKCRHPFYGAGGIPRLFPCKMPPGDRPHPPDTGAHGPPGPPHLRGYGLRGQKAGAGADRPVPPRGWPSVHPPQDRGGGGAVLPAERCVYRPAGEAAQVRIQK